MGVNKTLQRWNGMQMRFAVIILIFLFAGLFAFTLDYSTHAATTLPTKMNFQGRVTNASGNILANGTYNMRFKIFNAATAGTQQWAEDRLVSAGQGVVVTNGQFSVQLGSVTSLPASIFASNSLHFEVELPTPASATTSSPVWTEGAMTPRNQLATSAYAYNSETLDGLDSAAFGQLDQNNVFTGNNTFNGTLQGGSSLTLGTTSVAGTLSISDGSSNTGTIAMAPTAGNYTYTIPVTTASDTFCLATLANCSGISAIGSLDGTTASANGAAIVGSTLFLQSASTSNAGLVNTTTQSFAGNKTFTGTVAVSGATTLNDTVTIAADKTIKFVGGATASRPVSPGDGAIYFDTSTKQLLTFSNGKWQADKTGAIIVAASNSSQAEKDIADYVADGEAVSGAGTIDGDQVQINTALTAGAGKTVVLLAGTYTADATILVPNNTVLAGVGNGTLIQLADLDIAENLIENTDQTTGTGITLRDIKIDGQKTLNTAGSQYGIFLNNMGGGTGSTARKGAYATNITITNFRSYGMSLSNSNNSEFIGLSAIGNTSAAYHMTASDRNVFTSNKALGNGNGFSISTADNSTFTGNMVEGGANEAFSIGSSTNNSFSGNTTVGNSTGFYLSAATDNVLTGNSVQSPTGNGFSFTLGANSNLVNGNRIVNSGGSTTNEAIYVAANSDSNSISNNQISDSSATSTNYAINLAINTVDSTYVAANTLGTGTINDLGTGTIYGGQVDGSGNFNIQPSANINLNKNTVVSAGSLTLGNSTTLGNLVLSDGNGQTGTLRMADTAGSFVYTIPVTTANDTFCMLTLANCGSGGGGATSVGTLNGGTANATGGSIVGSVLYLQSASASFAGLVDINSQTFAGDKTFNGTLTVGSAATFNNTLTVGTSTNGIVLTNTGITIAGTARSTNTIMLAPEFPGATFTSISANFNGSLSSDFCSGSSLLNVNATACAATDEHNYYAWTTTQATAQDYGVYVRYRVPSNYDTGSMTNLKLWGRGTTASEVVGVVMYKGATACATISDVVTGANTWVETTVASPLGSCTIAADDIITFRFNMTATTNNTARLGELSYTYRSKF